MSEHRLSKPDRPRLRGLLILGRDRGRRTSIIVDLYDKPLLPTWHTRLAAE